MLDTHLHGDVLEIVLANPPVNALAAPLRKALMKAIADAPKSGAKAIVIRGGGGMFSAGADISEFDQPLAEPNIPEIIDAIEASPILVVAAIYRAALGGGLELALGCHYRIATPGAKLGLPEVLLGILPGAGGTQRLPRLIGVKAALEMIVSGAPIGAETALDHGLVDQLASEEQALAREAIAYARTLKAPRPTGEMRVAADPAVFDRFAAENARRIKGLDAPKACIEAVRAATTLSLKAGLATEERLFKQLVVGDQSMALRHVFFAERAAAKIDGQPKDLALRPIRKVGVIGAGTMGGGIAMNFLSAGIPVAIVEMHQDALDRGVDVMRKNYQSAAVKGRLTQAQVDDALNLLTATLEFDALADCDLVIEAVYEDMQIKKQIFARLDGVSRRGAILASNTSFLSIDEIAAVTSRPGDVVGLHFFSPANVMKLLEVVRGVMTAPDVLATAMDLARKIGKAPVVSGVCYGFIGNRMLIPRQVNAEALLLEGATPEQIDRVHTRLGMPMGVFQMSDLAGVDVGWHREPERIESLQDALCAQGRWGQKTKAGFYDYDETRKPTPSPAVQKIIDDFRVRSGIHPREISDEEITVRTLYTMVNEGAKILEEGIAQRASDIDVVWIYGYGWPRHTGGIIHWANRVGLKTIVDQLARYSPRLGPAFTLSPLLASCAARGAPLER